MENVAHMKRNDDGLGGGTFYHLKEEREVSTTRCQKKGFQSCMQTSRSLKEKVKSEMIPSETQSSATGAKFELQGALCQTGRRWLERADVKPQLRLGSS